MPSATGTGTRTDSELNPQPMPPAYLPGTTASTQLRDLMHPHLPQSTPSAADGQLNEDVSTNFHQFDGIEDSHPPPAYCPKPPPTYAPRERNSPAPLPKPLAFMKKHKKLMALAILVSIAVAVIVPCILIFKVHKDEAQPLLDHLEMSGRYSSYQLVFEESLGLNFEFSDMLTRDTYLQTSKWFHLDSFDAKLYMEDTLPDFKTFGRLQAPELSVPPYEFYKIYDYIYPSDDERAEFIRFLRRLLEETEVKVGMRGNTMMKMKGLPKYTVNWNKTLTFRGLGGISEFRPGYCEFLNSSQGYDYEFFARGSLTLPNIPSMSKDSRIDIGSISVDVLTDDELYLGHGDFYVEGLPQIYPSQSELRIQFDETMVRNIQQMAGEYTGTVMKWILTFKNVTGKKYSWSTGFDSPWLGEAVKDMKIPMYVDITQALEDIETRKRWI